MSVVVAEFNGDGKPDLASADYIGSGLSVLLNTTATGSSSFDFSARLALGGAREGVVRPTCAKASVGNLRTLRRAGWWS